MAEKLGKVIVTKSQKMYTIPLYFVYSLIEIYWKLYAFLQDERSFLLSFLGSLLKREKNGKPLKLKVTQLIGLLFEEKFIKFLFFVFFCSSFFPWNPLNQQKDQYVYPFSRNITESSESWASQRQKKGFSCYVT